MESIHNHPYGYNDDCKSCKRPYWHRPHPPKQGSECNICQKIIEIFRCKDDRKYMVGFREESFYGYPCALCENPARMWAKYIPSDFCEPVCFDCVEENGFMINQKNCWWTNIYRNVKDCDMIRQVQKWGYETVEDFLENRDNKTKIAIRSEKTITKKIEHEIDDDPGILSKGMKIPDELQSLASEDTCVGYWDLRTHRGQIDYVGKDSRYRVPWDGKMTESDDYIYDLVKRQI